VSRYCGYYKKELRLDWGCVERTSRPALDICTEGPFYGRTEDKAISESPSYLIFAFSL
jgi:hypothetical protein